MTGVAAVPGNPPAVGGAGPVNAAYQVLRVPRGARLSTAEFGGLDVSSPLGFQSKNLPRPARIAADPPSFRSQQLPTLLDAAVVRMPYGPSPTVESTGADVRLWWTPLDVPASALRDFEDCLSGEELTRAAGFHRPVDRRHFVVARGSLRRLLARLLGCTPGEVCIIAGNRSKPRLAGSELRFNASRSANVALYAASWTTEVGVDVEAIRVTADVDGLAARFFSPAEQRSLAPLPPTERLVACYQCWTRKEAYLKGIGVGLALPLRDIDLSVLPRRTTEVSHWSVHQIEVLPGFAAAVAGKGLGATARPAIRRLDVGASPQDRDRRLQ